MSEEKPKKIGQSLLVSSDEISLLKSVFADNDEMLRLVRNLFFGLELSPDEKATIIATFKAKEIRDIVRRRFLPTATKDTPVGQTVDLWTGVDVKDKNSDQIYQVVSARQQVIEYTKTVLNLLENPDGPKISLDFDPNYESGMANMNISLQVSLVARNTFISHIETQLIMIKVISGTKIETPEEARKRLSQDSNK